MNEDRRNSERVPCGLELVIELPGTTVKANVMNISKQGMFVRAGFASPLESLRLMAALQAGAAVQLTLQQRGGLLPAEARGVVAWKSDLGVGITFSQVNPALEAFITALATGPNALERVLAPAKLGLGPFGSVSVA
ncbi:MAG TPA: PilZ domain-containing protein [Polyangiaceae bacterium]|nr:PilZ domain-containing protein [Polyangiaceae bacterium]